MNAQRLVIGVGSVIAALLLAAVILLIVVMNQNSAAAEQVEHDRHVQICKGQIVDPLGENLDQYLACLQDLKNY